MNETLLNGIYIAKNDAQSGPYTEEQVRGMLGQGLISATDIARREGYDQWVPLGKMLGLSMPPPMHLKVGVPAAREGSTRPAIDGPTGVGGWLVFFCVGLTIIAPPLNLLPLVLQWPELQPAFAAYPPLKMAWFLESLWSLVILIYGFVVGVRIWKGDPAGRKLARQFLLIRFFGLLAVEVIAILMMVLMIKDPPPELISGGIAGVIGGLVQTALYVGIWWLYFSKSKRVRNTYGPE